MFSRFRRPIRDVFCGILFLLAATGCRSIGPGTIARDRFDYSTSITESWKRQTLLNVVRLRYFDPPSFVDVGQIVAGYSLETGLAGAGQTAGAAASGDAFGTIGGHVTFTDRPTITYTPLTGTRFVRGLMTPIPPESLFYTIQSSWPADAILKAGVISINGLKNEEISMGGYHAPDPRFLRAAELMRAAQVSGAVGMRIVQDKDKHETKVLTFRTQAATPEIVRNVAEFRELLGLNPDAQEFQLVYGATASNDHEIAVQTRSLLHIFAAMAARAEVPPEHLREGRVVPGVESSQGAGTNAPAPQIRCSKDKPKDAFAAVQYRDHWFWVDDRDLAAKRSFSFMMLLFTLADTGEKENLPLITIPAQ